MIYINIAVPERCLDCPCHDKTNDRCQADSQNRFCANESNKYDCNVKPTWCPIMDSGKAVRTADDFVTQKVSVSYIKSMSGVGLWTFNELLKFLKRNGIVADYEKDVFVYEMEE